MMMGRRCVGVGIGSHGESTVSWYSSSSSIARTTDSRDGAGLRAAAPAIRLPFSRRGIGPPCPYAATMFHWVLAVGGEAD